MTLALFTLLLALLLLGKHTLAAIGYDPARSRNNPDTLADFLRSPITGDLTEVPGIGPATAKKMKEAGVSTTYALFGKFLMLKQEDVQSVEHCDRFFHWLESIGTPAGFRSSVVEAVAKKMDITYPGIYDGDRGAKDVPGIGPATAKKMDITFPGIYDGGLYAEADDL